MPERTADLRRVVDLVRCRGGARRGLAVVGHACPWREDLRAVLGERLPEVAVSVCDTLPEGGSVTVWLELEESEARLQALRHEWESSGARARGEILGEWTAGRPGPVADPEAEGFPDVDVVFVPVSGVRPPRRILFSWDDPVELLWDEHNSFIGEELVDVLPLPPELRQELEEWTPERWRSDPRDLVVRLREALGPDFDVRT